MQEFNLISETELRELASRKRLYIWGSGRCGISIGEALSRKGMPIHGFVDQHPGANGKNNGLECITPEAYFSRNQDDRLLILAAVWPLEQMVATCRDLGLVEYEDYITYRHLRPYNYEIDVSGYCNLRCLTCPNGNRPKKNNQTMMTLKTFKEILTKLVHENPFVTDVQLYSWGEPLLNQELPEMISYANQLGIANSISSNLSLKCDLEKIVRAKPTWFRVSISGWGENYGINHQGGRWDLVLENLRELSLLKSQLHPEMITELNLHIYKYNKNDVNKFIDLCNELSIKLHLSRAMIYPLESLMDFLEEKKVSYEFIKGTDLLDFDLKRDVHVLSKNLSCAWENQLVIDSNLQVNGCCEIYDDRRSIIAKNYLETPLNKIIDAKKNMEICKRCRKIGAFKYQYSETITLN